MDEGRDRPCRARRERAPVAVAGPRTLDGGTGVLPVRMGQAPRPREGHQLLHRARDRRAGVPGPPRVDGGVRLRRPSALGLRDPLRRRTLDHHHVRRDPDGPLGAGQWPREPGRAHGVRLHRAARVARDARRRPALARLARRARPPAAPARRPFPPRVPRRPPTDGPSWATPTAAPSPATGLADATARRHTWTRWGPCLAERQWGTVREDYAPDGTCWDYFPHDHARSRTYRWGEDGLLGLTDRECRLCFAVALWNGRDPILKERLFGLTGPEGNHGEDVKECYFYLDATPTASYLKALYKYPQREFPYARLVEEGRLRGKQDTEFELVDTGVFDDGRYFDVTAEYAKASPEDILVRLTIANRGPDAAPLHVLPTLWFRNTWSWGRTGEGYWPKARLARAGEGTIVAEHASLGRYRLVAEGAPELLFTENETNVARLFGAANPSPWGKDAVHDYVVHGRADAVNPEGGV